MTWTKLEGGAEVDIEQGGQHVHVAGIGDEHQHEEHGEPVCPEEGERVQSLLPFSCMPYSL